MTANNRDWFSLGTPGTSCLFLQKSPEWHFADLGLIYMKFLRGGKVYFGVRKIFALKGQHKTAQGQL
ncbi:MAG: hypothetical protein DRI57_04695 [Deltaproteobacteria bacterium]|nr:MAG: hypothetical protein DRI57_04695 [Deltaproteobacteria bacterium]